jgi:hypothetical protein
MTIDIKRAVSSLPPRSVRAILEELVKTRRDSEILPAGWEANAPQLPLVTLHLKSGKEFRGWVIGLGEGETKDAVLLHRHDYGARSVGTDVLYLDLNNVEAVTLHEAVRPEQRRPDEVRTNSTASVSSPTVSKQTREETQRKVEELARFVSSSSGLNLTYEANWDELPKEEAAFNALSEAALEVTGVLSVVLSQARGVAAVRDNLKTVKFINAAEPAVTRDGSALTIASNLKAGKQGLYPRAQLRETIEKLF